MTAIQQRMEPADTRIMGIVHDALRRDLRRTRAALSQPPYPGSDQRKAIADHVTWMMRYLHHHHEGEDHGLWPLLRRNAPEAGPLLDTLETDHATIAEAVVGVNAAAAKYGFNGSDQARLGLLAAVGYLEQVLLPHLEREEQDAMPMVAVALTAAEWNAWTQGFIRHKSFAELGEEGHWLLDGLDASRYQVVVSQVPANGRFILLHGFARRYRRHAMARWGMPEINRGNGQASSAAEASFSSVNPGAR